MMFSNIYNGVQSVDALEFTANYTKEIIRE